jgi:KDO2-lipid IV(A) lauroyltransferase
LLAYLVFLLCSFIWQRLPRGVGYALAEIIGDLTYLLWRKGRRYAVANMRQVLGPGGDAAAARRLARRSLRNYCKTLADFLRFPRLTEEEVDSLVHFDRWDLFDGALAAGKGVIFATMHIGNWDMGGAAIAKRGYLFAVLADSFGHEGLNRRILQARQDKGIRVVPAGGVPKSMVQTLRNNGVLAMLVDRPVKGGVEVNFFGAPARVPAGAATLALKTGATILPGCLVRLPDNSFLGLVDEPIVPALSGEWGERDVRNLTQRIINSLEGMIRRYPEQWYMFRPMWAGRSPRGKARAVRQEGTGRIPDRLKYYLFELARHVLPLLPARLGYRLASLAGSIAYLVSGRGRAAVQANLDRVLGPKVDPAQRNRLVRRVFQNAAKNYFDLFRVPRLHPAEVEKVLSIHNWERLEQALAQGKGVVLATAHFGNFDLVGQVLAGRSLPVTAIAESLQPPQLFHLVTGMRNSKGLSFIPAGPAAVRAVIKALRRGEIVGMACDRDIQGKGLRVRFFGEETRLPTGAMFMGVKTGAPIVPAFVVRRPDDTFTAFVESPIEVGPAQPEEEVVRRCTEQMAALLERYISQYPDQWVVFEPIWRDGRN